MLVVSVVASTRLSFIHFCTKKYDLWDDNPIVLCVSLIIGLVQMSALEAHVVNSVVISMRPFIAW